MSSCAFNATAKKAIKLRERQRNEKEHNREWINNKSNWRHHRRLQNYKQSIKGLIAATRLKALNTHTRVMFKCGVGMSEKESKSSHSVRLLTSTWAHWIISNFRTRTNICVIPTMHVQCSFCALIPERIWRWHTRNEGELTHVKHDYKLFRLFTLPLHWRWCLRSFPLSGHVCAREFFKSSAGPISHGRLVIELKASTRSAGMNYSCFVGIELVRRKMLN